MSDWQVQAQISVNVDDCKDAKEAELRVLRCLPGAIINSARKQKIVTVHSLRAIERATQSASQASRDGKE